jgi:hypothetical protein
VAKRSPILGYNHNVRYRGLVFHVQTEDSGLLSPHLFTHLFHGGVIISTRKLVYDAGAAEDAIKSLMQAQHKAVLKDLKKGSFDDKIDVYLAGTPGLLPRGEEAEGDGRESTPSLQTPTAGMPSLLASPASGMEQVPDDAPRTAADYDTAPVIELSNAKQPARTKTENRGSAPSAVRTNLPPPPPVSLDELGGPTLNDREAASVAAAVAAANATIPNRLPTGEGSTVPMELPDELSPLEIELELDEPDDPPPRPARDTDVAQTELERAVTKRVPGESVPPLPPPPHSHPRASSSVGAAALPPKPPTGPTRLPSRPAISPPQVVSRPIAPKDADTSGAVEVYAPPPPGADAPPGAERPGQYSQHKRVSTKIPSLDGVKERGSTSVPVPAGLARPNKISTNPTGVPKMVGASAGSNSTSKRDTGGAPIVASSSGGVPQTHSRAESSGTNRPRTPTPSRLASPAASRTSSSSSGGVVMTRPAVIVGAPAKPNQPARVRKAREDEGRGFGQGLISEKSLDEVILAYLSEDADEK